MARRSKKNDIRDRVKAYTKQAIVEADTFRQEVLFPAVLKANAQYRGDLPTRLTPKKRRRIYYQKTRQRVQALQGEIINAAFSAGRNILNLRRQGLEDSAEVRVLHEVVNWHLRNTINTFGLFVDTGEDAQLRNAAAIKVGWRYVKTSSNETIDLPDGTTQDVQVDDIVEDQPVCKAVPLERLRWNPETTAIGVPWEDCRFLSHSEWYVTQDLVAAAAQGLFNPEVVERIVGEYTRKKKEGAELDRGGVEPMRFPEAEIRDSTRGYTFGALSQEQGVEVAEVQTRLDLDGDGYPEKVWYYYAPAYDELLTDPIPLPWPDRLFNIVVGTAIPRAYRVHGENIPEQIADLQASVNSKKNRLDDALAMIVEQGWIVENGSNTDVAALATSRYITTTDDINSVRPRDHQEVPQTFFTGIKDDEQEIDERLGITSTYLGSSQIPASAPATTSVQSAQQSGQRIGYLMNALVHTLYLPAFKKLALYVAKYESDEEIFRIANELSKSGQTTSFFPNADTMAYDLRVTMAFGPNDSVIKTTELTQLLGVMMQIAGTPLQSADGTLVVPNIKQLVDDIMRLQNVPDSDAYWLPAAQPALPPHQAGGVPPGGPEGPTAGGRPATVSKVGGPELPLDALMGAASSGVPGLGSNV